MPVGSRFSGKFPAYQDNPLGGERVFRFTSLDRLHGFNCPDLGIRSDVVAGKVSRVGFTPTKTGAFPYHCENFCGEGHENMTGAFIVIE